MSFKSKATDIGYQEGSSQKQEIAGMNLKYFRDYFEERCKGLVCVNGGCVQLKRIDELNKNDGITIHEPLSLSDDKFKKKMAEYISEITNIDFDREVAVRTYRVNLKRGKECLAVKTMSQSQYDDMKNREGLYLKKMGWFSAF